jgi:hypothetical protein
LPEMERGGGRWFNVGDVGDVGGRAICLLKCKII